MLNNRDWRDIKSIKITLASICSLTRRASSFPGPRGRLLRYEAHARGNFLVGSFRIGATIRDRMQASVEISREHADFFVKNMAAILCEERLALTVTRPNDLRLSPQAVAV